MGAKGNHQHKIIKSPPQNLQNYHPKIYKNHHPKIYKIQKHHPKIYKIATPKSTTWWTGLILIWSEHVWSCPDFANSWRRRRRREGAQNVFLFFRWSVVNIVDILVFFTSLLLHLIRVVQTISAALLCSVCFSCNVSTMDWKGMLTRSWVFLFHICRLGLASQE